VLVVIGEDVHRDCGKARAPMQQLLFVLLAPLRSKLVGELTVTQFRRRVSLLLMTVLQGPTRVNFCESREECRGIRSANALPHLGVFGLGLQ
jgi:hypothetical protein